MSEVKVNKITPRAACGTTQLGDSGDTFTIPSGATIQNLGTATGFGGTGVVSWDTASIKTTGFTAVTGTGYFCNTTAGAFSVTLPLSPSAGDVVGVSDYAKTFDTDNLTLLRNGSNISGGAGDALISTEGVAVTLVYVDATKGWIVTDSGNQSDAPLPTYIAATGGCITTCGNYKMHTFTGPSTFCVSAIGNPAGSTAVDYMVVAGGAGGGAGASPGHGAGGGGAGGFRESPGAVTCYTASPLGAAPAAAISVSVQGYPITVGGGGAGSASCSTRGINGDNSVFSTITSTAGGGGGVPYYPTTVYPGNPGGSGGGGASEGSGTGGTGNTPPTNPSQGNDGGTGVNAPGPTLQTGAGGGATAVGTNGAPGGTMGAGGAGAGTAINLTTMPAPSPTPSAQIGTPGPSPSVRYFSGGGGAGATGPCTGAAGPGGTGGGGIGGTPGTAGTAGIINTGGGGGGGKGGPPGGTSGGNGGSGIVVIRYKYQ